MSQAPGQPHRILLVEDEPANRMLLRAVLARASDPLIRGADVREAGSLAQARRILAEQRPDLVVLDNRLPDGSGLDLARDLHAITEADRPAILILSASVLPHERSAALTAGATAFMGKPYVPAALLQMIQGLLADDSSGGGGRAT